MPSLPRTTVSKTPRYTAAFFFFLFLEASLIAQTLLGNVGTGTNPHAVAVNPVTGKVFVANYHDGTVSEISGASSRTSTITVGTNPTAVAVNPLTNKIYVANFGSGNVSVIDGNTNAVTATVTVGSNPDAIAVNIATNLIYVANNGSGNMTVINGATNAPTPVTVGNAPVAIAVNSVTNTIYVANNGSKSITVVNGASNGTAPVTVGTSPTAIAVNPITNQVYVANGGSGNVTVVDGATLKTTPVTAGTNPFAIAINPETNKIYVANLGGDVTVIDGTDNSTNPVTAGTSPYAIAVDPLTNQAYVANNGSNNVTVIDNANGTTTVNAGTNPYAVAVNPVIGKVYVLNDGSANLTLIDAATAQVNSTTAPGVYVIGSVVADRIANKTYVETWINIGGGTHTELDVIDGVTNSFSTLLTGSYAGSAGDIGAFVMNPTTNRIYYATSSGSVVVVDATTGSTLATIPSAGTPFAVNEATNTIYSYVSSSELLAIDGATNTTTTISSGLATYANGSQLQVDEAINKVFALNYAGGIVIDGFMNTISTVPVPGNNTKSLSVDVMHGRVYTGNSAGATIDIVDASTNSIVSTAKDINYPWALAANPVSNRVYMANFNGNNVAVLDTITNTAQVLATGMAAFLTDVAGGTNRVWVGVRNNGGVPAGTLAMFDGAATAPASLPLLAVPKYLTTNDVTGRVYVPQGQSVSVGSADIVQTSAVTTTITPITDSQTRTGYTVFATLNQTPQFTVNATCNYSPATLAPTQLYYQLDTISGIWKPASAPISTGANSAKFTVTPSTIPWGLHSLYVYARCGDIVGSTAMQQFLILTGTGTPASLTSPASGSTLSGSSLTFGWTGGVNVTDYTLKIGTTVGGSDIANIDAGTATSKLVSGLPTNGETLYAQLGSEIGGLWYYNSVTYIAYGTGTAAAITSPTPGSKLTSATATFHWSAGSGISQYTLQIGTTPGAHDIDYIHAGTATSATVNNLPTNGSKFYVYVYSLNGNTWLHNGYSYIASGTGTAGKITSPTPGSKLTSSIVLFDWSAGVGIAQYQLNVGTTAGAHDIAQVNAAASATSASVSNLPTDGSTIYVDLLSLNGATWLTNANTYTAAGSGSAASITSPANHSTLPGATATFNWSGGGGITEYVLWIGSTANAHDIDNAVLGSTATSFTATNLPTNGETVYVTLNSQVNGTFLKNSYTYTASGHGTAAAITSPANNSKLTSASATFKWSGGVGIDEYVLWIGSKVGQHDIDNVVLGATGTSASVSNLPTNGSTVYVTLNSLNGSTWLKNSYTYTASGP